MASSGAAAYAAINARARVKYSTLLSGQAFHELSDAPDLASLILQLRSTPYGPYFEKVKDKEMTPKRAAFILRGRVADDYLSLIRMAPESSRPLLAQLYRHFEVDNLKALLRGLYTGSSWDQVRFVLFPLGSFSVLPAQAMMETGSISAAVELLNGTAYAETLSHSMKRFGAEQALFPLEVALDLHYWRALWKEIRRMGREDIFQAMRIVGSLVDFNNLMWAIRYRTFYHFSEEELINYTLPFGYRVHDEHIRAIAAGGDIGRVLTRLYPRMGSFDALLQDPQKGLLQVEMLLQKNIMEQCEAAFIGDPFHVGILLAYLLLTEFEVRNLTTLIEAKANQMTVEEFRAYLLVSAVSL